MANDLEGDELINCEITREDYLKEIAVIDEKLKGSNSNMLRDMLLAERKDIEIWLADFDREARLSEDECSSLSKK